MLLAAPPILISRCPVNSLSVNIVPVVQSMFQSFGAELDIEQDGM